MERRPLRRAGARRERCALRPTPRGVAAPLRPKGHAEVAGQRRAPLGDVRLPSLIERRERQVLVTGRVGRTPNLGAGAWRNPPRVGFRGALTPAPGGRDRGPDAVILGRAPAEAIRGWPHPPRRERRPPRTPGVARPGADSRGDRHGHRGRAPVRGAGALATTTRTIAAIAVVGHRTPIVGGRARPVIARRPVVTATVAT